METAAHQPAIQNYPPSAHQVIHWAARDVLEDLEIQPAWETGQTRRWHWTDKGSFLTWCRLEAYLPKVDGTLRTALIEPVNAWHTALPYNEAERHWLVHTSWRSDDTVNEWLARTRRQEVQLTASGLICVVYGRDLFRRWWAWRRQTDEYAGQDSLSLACDGLTDIMAAIAATRPTPDPLEPSAQGHV